jgi:hypothetical protein
MPSAPPSAAPSRVETPASPAEAPAPRTSPVATSRPAASSTPVAWTELERVIRDNMRDDAAVGCAPRRHDLPPGTVAAVECRPGVAPVSRVGFYLFASPEDARDVYIDRVKEQGLALNTEQGRRGWERAGYICSEAEVECAERDAGFVNSDGYANYRAVMGAMYIGVLGTRDDIEDLRGWAWESTQECPPGPDTCPVPESPSLYCDGLQVAADASCVEPVSDQGWLTVVLYHRDESRHPRSLAFCSRASVCPAASCSRAARTLSRPSSTSRRI